MKPQTIYSHLTDIALYDQNPHIAVLSKRNEERDDDRGCGAEGRAGKDRFFFARMKKERGRVSEIRMIGAVKDRGRASWSGKHFTDICPDSGRHKRV